jgi:hypothetical protein
MPIELAQPGSLLFQRTAGRWTFRTTANGGPLPWARTGGIRMGPTAALDGLEDHRVVHVTCVPANPRGQTSLCVSRGSAALIGTWFIGHPTNPQCQDDQSRWEILNACVLLLAGR